jgi:predicted RNA-binding Zn ribbon-like protein
VAAGLIDPADAVLARLDPTELDARAATAIELREWLGTVVGQWASGDRSSPDRRDRAELNELLAVDNRHAVSLAPATRMTLVDRRTCGSARVLQTRPALPAAELFAHGDRSLLRNCRDPTASCGSTTAACLIGVGGAAWPSAETAPRHRRIAPGSRVGNRAGSCSVAVNRCR